MLYNILDRFIVLTGKGIRWLTSLLVLIICSDVIFRYAFNFSKTWIIDLEWWLFSIIFLIGAAYTLREDKHVRVDIFYSRLSETKQAWINMIGTTVLLIPWCILIIVKSYHYALNSWVIREGSPDPGGLPGRYVIKSVICIAFILLIIQAILLLIENGKIIRKSWK